MNKLQRYLFIAASGIALIALSWLWMVGELGFYAVLGIVPGLLGLLLISYALYQVHEVLLAFFWGSLFLASALHWLSISENYGTDILAILLMGIPGAGLLVFGLRLLFKRRRASSK
ncbi:MAG: hypothetical protein P3T54_05605 [Dehalogenimonas sp.]|uniref:Uncharacterized protein n=1 Tax=Candidatus Dehalogenimonas loeffleri TaxID=3127115 RepID=A0ABZ2J8E4_9CHLR|nr:hypothetical protein [Dehalogenimonas sp.]